MRIYRLESGILIESDKQFHLVEDRDWDAFVNDDGLFEKAAEIVALWSRDISVGDIEVRVAIVIEIPEVRAPGPASHLDASMIADVFKFSVSLVSVERIAAGMPSVKSAYICRRFFLKDFLR